MWPRHFTEMGYGFCNWGPSFGHGFFGWVFPLLFWGTILYIGIWLVKQIVPNGHSAKYDNAFETLRNRYASGEINQKEYDERRATLKMK